MKIHPVTGGLGYRRCSGRGSLVPVSGGRPRPQEEVKGFHLWDVEPAISLHGITGPGNCEVLPDRSLVPFGKRRARGHRGCVVSWARGFHGDLIRAAQISPSEQASAFHFLGFPKDPPALWEVPLLPVPLGRCCPLRAGMRNEGGGSPPVTDLFQGGLEPSPLSLGSPWGGGGRALLARAWGVTGRGPGRQRGWDGGACQAAVTGRLPARLPGSC